LNIIKPNTLTTIQVSPDFTTRLQELLIWIISNQKPDAIKNVNERILASQELTEDWEHHYFTMLVLVNDLEESANAQNNTEIIDMSQYEKNPEPK
jgi:hypothetical protein